MLDILAVVFFSVLVGIRIGRLEQIAKEKVEEQSKPSPCRHGYDDWDDCPDCGH